MGVDLVYLKAEDYLFEMILSGNLQFNGMHLAEFSGHWHVKLQTFLGRASLLPNVQLSINTKCVVGIFLKASYKGFGEARHGQRS